MIAALVVLGGGAVGAGVASDSVVRSERAATRGVELRAVAFGVTEEHVRIDIALRQTSADHHALLPDLAAGLELADVDGTRSLALALSGELEGASGTVLAPGGERAGAVIFARPEGATATLLVPGFPALAFDLATASPVTKVFGPDALALLSDGAESGVGAPPSQAIRSEDAASERVDLVAVLRAQAEALERYDVDAYLATFVPELRSRERDNMTARRELPIVEVRILPGRRPVVPEGGARRLQAKLRYRIDGLPDDNPFVHFLSFRFVRRDGGWLVDEIREEGALPLLWRRGRLSVHRSNHFVIQTDPRFRADLVQLSRDAESAYATLYRRGFPMASGYLIHFVDDRDMAKIAGRPLVPGVARSGYEVRRNRLDVLSRSLYLNATHFSTRNRLRLPDEQRLATLTHELVHLALSLESRPYTPVWLAEGAAVHFSDDAAFDDSRRLVRGGMDHLDLAAMTRARSLGEHSAARFQQADEYLFSGQVVAYLVEQKGVDAFFELYRSFATLGAGALVGDPDDSTVLLAQAFAQLSAETTARVTEDALRERYGRTIAELEADVKRWLLTKHR